VRSSSFFVDNGGIVDHNCLKFLFILLYKVTSFYRNLYPEYKRIDGVIVSVVDLSAVDLGIEP